MNIEELRSQFPIHRNYNFQNHAGVAPICTAAADAIRRYTELAEQSAYVEGGFYRHAEKVRASCAAVINAKPDEVTFIKNTSEGIALIANGLNWTNGDNVVITNAEFPANVYPWQSLQSQGVQVRMVMEEDGRIPLERMMESVNARTRVVSISSVQYASGFRTDLAALGKFCQQKGAFLMVDAIQSLGAFPVDVKGMNIDFLAADGHKWMCSAEGTGLFYVRKEIQGFLKPTMVGWLSMKEGWDFDHYLYELNDDIKRFDTGSYHLPGIYGLGGAIDFLMSVGIDNISERILALTDRLVDGLRGKGYRIVSSRQTGEGSGIVAFISDQHDHEKIRKHLQAEHRLVIAVRRGRLRASPHFYNTETEIDRLIESLPSH
jgi:selenocysteine lyase/cysteine desulfurase